MYVRREKSWLKHIDFALWDIFCIVVTFYVGYIFRHGVGSDFTDYYWRLLCILVVLDISVSLIRSSHTAIVRRGYLREILETVTHCSAPSRFVMISICSTFGSFFIFFRRTCFQMQRTMYVMIL